MSRNFYLKLFPVVMGLVLLTVSCNKKIVIGIPSPDDDDQNDGNNTTTEVLLPAEGYDPYSSGHTLGVDFTLAKPIDGYSTLINAVKYPESARSEGIEGVVILVVQLLSDGTIQEINSLDNNVDFRLLSASIDAILSVEWSPAIQNGIATDSYVTLPIRFSLNN